MRPNKKYFIVLTLYFAIQIMFGCKNGNSTDSVYTKTSIADQMSALNIQHVAKPVSAPDFELISVKGERVSLGQYRDKVILLSFWTTW